MSKIKDFKFNISDEQAFHEFTFDTTPVLEDLSEIEYPTPLTTIKPGKYNKYADPNFLKYENAMISTKKTCLKKKSVTEPPKDGGVLHGKALQGSKISQVPPKGERLLQNMSAAILDKCFIIRHNDGLYAFDGKIYTAIKNDVELLELVRNNVSTDAFSATSIKPFQDLYTYLKSDKRLIPQNYEEKLRKAHNLIPFSNGILDIETGELLDFSEKHLVFHMLNAKWKNKTPKAFMRVLKQISDGDEEVQLRVLESIGYLLSGSNDGKVFFVWGCANNSGKSTIAEFVRIILGDEFVSSISTHQLGERFSLGDIQGKILNMAMDVPNGKLNPTVVSVIKNITGKDSITIEQKYQRPETIRSNMRFLFGTNYPIRLPKEDDEDSFWNRMVIVPFQRSVPKEEIDVNLIDKLLEEKNAIVTMCIKAYQQVRNNNFRFSTCRVADDMKRSWRKSDLSNYSFMAFWHDHIEITGNMDDSIFATDLYESYCVYCFKNKFEYIGYKDMRAWIENNVDRGSYISKRLHRTNENPRAAYCGFKFID